MPQYVYVLLILACLLALGILVAWLFYRHAAKREQLRTIYSEDLNYFKRHIAVQEEEIHSLRQSEQNLKSRLAETLSLHWSEALSNFWAKMQIEIDRREKLINELKEEIVELEKSIVKDQSNNSNEELDLLVERLKVLGEENIELKKAIQNWEQDRSNLESQIESLTQENNEMEIKLRGFYDTFNRILGSKDNKKKKKKKKKDKSIRKPLAKALKASRQKKKKQSK